MRILHLYRPRLPSLRAQAIQVLHMCHALAKRGHSVTLFADRPLDGSAPDASAIVDAFGLDPVGRLDLRVCPVAHPPLAGAWFRSAVARWWAGPPGLVLARDLRRLSELLALPSRHRIVVEVHELDSAIAAEAGRSASALRLLERRVARASEALVANCGGVLALWEEAHSDAIPVRRGAAHNATSPARMRGPCRSPDPVLRAVGTLRAVKGVAWLRDAAPSLPLPLEFVGGDAHERASFGPLPPNCTVREPVPYREVPDLLARTSALLVPLADNLFGRSLTSPLKVWDYLATAVPIVCPDLPSMREIAAMSGPAANRFHWFRTDDATDLARATRAALDAGPGVPFVRTWDRRAAELESIVGDPPSRDSG